MTTQEERQIEGIMLIAALEEEKDNIVALRRLLIHGAITTEEHSTILARLQERVRITKAQLAEL